MIESQLDDLLARFSAGDELAAAEVFRMYEPFLRLVVRRHLTSRLRVKLDSVDIVQSVWADVLTGFRAGNWTFTNAAQLRTFLAKAARNRLIDRVRQHRAATEHEQPLAAVHADLAPTFRGPRPSEQAQADELWQQMLTVCPPAYHELLRLKRQGLELTEIAERTGLHYDSVRRILRKLARELARRGLAAFAGTSSKP